VTFGEFFKTDQQFAIAVEPGVRSFHHPSARAIVRVFVFLKQLLSPLPNMRRIAMLANDFPGRFADIPLVQTEVLLCRPTGFGPFGHHSFQGFFQQFHVMHVGPAHDYRQRDSTLVHQQAAFCPFFFPDPWGSALLPQPPVAL